MTADDDIEIIEKTAAYSGYFRIDRYRLRHRRFDGSWSRPVVREVFERGHAAGVLLYDPDRDAVVLIEQFRAGAMAAGRPAWMIEVVAGIIEEGETPENVVRREAMEEAGCTVTDLVPIIDYLSSPGGASESCTLFCGRIDSTEIGGHYGVHDEDEDIRAFVVSVDAAIAMLNDSRAANAVTIIALQWLALNRESLRQRWARAASSERPA